MFDALRTKILDLADGISKLDSAIKEFMKIRYSKLNKNT